LRIFIITEGLKNTGYGHITRCLSLYQAFEERNISPIIFVNGDNNCKPYLENARYEIIDWLSEENNLFEKIKKSDVIIIDSYLANLNFYKKISLLTDKPVYVDDNLRLEYPQGIIINGTINAQNFDYPLKDEIVYLLGLQYIPLRKEFWNVPDKYIRDKMEEILIILGGYDNHNLIPDILKFFSNSNPLLKKNVVVGSESNNLNEIKKVVDSHTEIIINANAEKMKRIMLKSDLAISAGGQTLYELARVGLPSIVIGAAENQSRNIKGWAEVGFIKFIGWWHDLNLLKNLEKAFTELENFSERKEISFIGRKNVDGAGCLRIIDKVLKRSL